MACSEAAEKNGQVIQRIRTLYNTSFINIQRRYLRIECRSLSYELYIKGILDTTKF